MSLAQRSILSSSYSILSSGVQTIILFIRSILLARLLSPDIFGIYSYVAAFVLLSRSIPTFGMSSALIHRAEQSEGEAALRVHFTLNLVFNIIWVILLILIGSAFIDPENEWVLWILAITQFIDNLTLTANALLVRRVTYKRIAILELITTILATIFALCLAIRGAGIWSLISTDIIAAIVFFAGMYLIYPIWKINFGWSSAIIKYLLSFGKVELLATLLSQALDKVDDLWTGYFLGNTAMGFYSRAYTFATYPRKIISNPISSVAVGTYAELKNQPKQLAQAYFRVNSFLIRTGFFLAGILALIAPEFIRLLLGNQWLPMLTAFRLMLIYTMLDPLKMTISNLFIAIGKPYITARARAIQMIVLLSALLLFGGRFGIAGVAAAVNLMLVTGICILLFQARKFVNFSVWKLFAIPTFALFTGMVIARGALVIPGILGSSWRTGLVKILLFSTLYLGILFLLERNEIKLLINMVKKIKSEKELGVIAFEDQ